MFRHSDTECDKPDNPYKAPEGYLPLNSLPEALGIDADKATIKSKIETLGITGENAEVEQGEVYVYVTDGGEVYHTSRGCTYLLPRITGTSYENADRAGYRPCEYCGGGTGGKVYITEEGECFHSSRSCSRLRRSVKRVKLSETSLPACSKCGGGS